MSRQPSPASGAPGFLLRFLVGAAFGAIVALGVGLATRPSGIASEAGFGQGSTFELSDSTGGRVDFAVAPTAGPAATLAPQPATQTLQLVSYIKAKSSGATSGSVAPGNAAWLNPGVPRVPAITQFDGGPLADVNCTMAAGAMLARLTFGVVTTGSQLRALQDDQEGGTSLVDLQTAVDRGWGVHFLWGNLTPVQLRALLFAGAGAEVVGQYGEIPVDLRLQKDFTAAHAIYLDAFRPATGSSPAAYYVIDPLGHPWEGYRGDWWPADVIERFGLALGGGRISAAWGFPGGEVPAHHPVLPPSAYPSPSPSGSPVTSPSAPASPEGSPSPSATPSPSPTPAPTSSTDPMPTGDQGTPSDSDAGTTPPTTPTAPVGIDKAGLSALIAIFAHCTTQPIPADCPAGILGLVTLPAGPSPQPLPTPPGLVNLRYLNPIGPGMYQVIFESPPNAKPDLWVWTSGGAIKAAQVEDALLNGSPVEVGTVQVDPGTDFSLVATASGNGIRAASSVASVVTSP